MDSIETARLTGRRLCPDDFDNIRLFHTNSLVMADLGGVRDEVKSKENLIRNLRYWEDHGFGLWVFTQKGSGDVLGLAGFRQIEFLEKKEIDLAYMLLPEYWKRGFAVEISERLIESAFESFGFPSLIAKTRVSNLASQRVIQKLGFLFENELMDFAFPHFQYRLTRSRWIKT